MATIETRTRSDGKVTYRAKVRLKGFPSESATFEKKTDAKDWGKKIEAEMKAGRYFGASKKHTFADLAAEFKAHVKDEVRHEYWLDVLGKETLEAITPVRIRRECEKLLDGDTQNFNEPETGDMEYDGKRTKSKRTGATVNRYLAALSVCLSFAVKELEWLDRNPCERVRKYPESAGRVRYLSDEELPKLLEACKPHPDLYLALVLALSTGARQEEVMSLKYRQVDFKRRLISLLKTKNGETRAIPLVGTAYDLLLERSKVRNLADDRIFPPTGFAKKSEYIDLYRPWRTAIKKAGIQDFRWHDLRHTSASYLIMSGVTLVEVSKILGHKTLKMVLRYAHLSEGHVVQTGEKLVTKLGI